MTVTVRIPTPLRAYTDGRDEVLVEGGSIGEVLSNLIDACEGLGERVLDGDGGVRPFVNIYVGPHDVRTRNGMDTPVDDGDVVSIVPAVAGGQVDGPAGPAARKPER